VCTTHGVSTGELNEEDLLANDNSIIVVTRAGYIKRMPLADFQVSALNLVTLLHTEHVQ
jgi:DNA gyrase/topoisomerase IV subunit A